MNDATKNAHKSLEELKKQLQNAKPVTVDKTGRLSTPEEAALREKTGESLGGTVQVKPSRWF